MRDGEVQRRDREARRLPGLSRLRHARRQHARERRQQRRVRVLRAVAPQAFRCSEAAAGGYIWELPAGILDAPDEPPESCAARELAEEAGVEARELRHLGTIFTTPGFCDERIHLFLARGLRQAEHRHEADEVIAEIARLPLAEALAMVRRGEIVDGETIAGLHLAAAALAAV